MPVYSIMFVMEINHARLFNYVCYGGKPCPIYSIMFAMEVNHARLFNYVCYGGKPCPFIQLCLLWR